MESTGVERARDYYLEVVGPLVLAAFPALAHAAARLGSGSDVLGLDDETSRDHDWGLRITLLVDEHHVSVVDELLERSLPQTFHGLPTRFGTTWHPRTHHQVEVATADAFAVSRLGIEMSSPLGPVDWLTLTGQAVLEVTAGEVFRDDVGRLSAIRNALSWYPDDLWRYVLATDWARIGQELPFIGRAGERGDELGSRIIATRLVHTAMHLGFLLERQWPPYAKWLGTAFSALPSAGTAVPALQQSLTASGWRERESALCDALEILNDVQRSHHLPSPAHASEPFWNRPFRGLQPVAELLTESIVDTAVTALPAGVGSIEQFSDNVDVLTSADLRSSFTGALAG